MSTTRLLLLGAVRIFQPVHGYLLRRELISWQVQDWAHINPGSIYSGLRTLAKQALLEELPGDPVAYRLTPDGEVAYQRLLAQVLREPDWSDPTRLLGGLCFFTTLPRGEVREALRARGLVLEAAVSGTASAIRSVEQNRTAPASTTELFRVAGHWLEGERQRVREVCDRIDAGHYRFARPRPHVQEDEAGGPRRRRCGPRRSTPVRSWASSAPTAPARPPRCACSPRCSSPRPARRRCPAATC